MRTLFLILFCILAGVSLQGCAKTQIIDSQNYLHVANKMRAEFESKKLPTTKNDIAKAADTSGTSFGNTLFTQLSPDFLQEGFSVYYIGETFKKTIQPRRSTYKITQNGFTIDHISQRVVLSMLALVDWDQDNETEWLVACNVSGKNSFKKEMKTIYLLIPKPNTTQEILLATPLAVEDCSNLPCSFTPAQKIVLRKNDTESVPKTTVEEFLPGEKEITLPPKEYSPSKESSSIQERTL